MNYAVKMFKYLSPKIVDAPGEYPAEIRPLGSGTTLPSGAGWQLMTDAELAALQSLWQTEFDAWKSASAATPQAQNHEVYVYSPKGFILSQTWYKTKVSTGVYADKAREILYTYDSTGQSIVSTVENLYDTSGGVYSTTTTNFLQDTSSSTSKTVVFEKQ